MKKTILFSCLSIIALSASSINFHEAYQNPKRVAPSKNDSILSFHDSIKDVKNSVVNISTTKKIRQNQQFEEMLNNPFLREFFGYNFDLPKKNRKASSLGSGVIISEDGYIITNNHVVEGADEILVSIPQNSKDYKAKIIGADPKTDLAVIKIEAKDLSVAFFADSSKLQEGDVVFAIGNPFGVGSSVTQGIVSALNKSNIGINQYENFIQTDASINPGNSGGALVDSRGALVGINSAILSRSGGNNGIGFAIPSNMVKTVSQALIEDGKIDRGYIGVMISNLTKEQKEIYKNEEGALIAQVEPNMPAAKAGLRRGDLIIEIDGKSVKSANDLKNIVGSMTPGKTVNVKFERQNNIQKTKITLAQMEASLSNNNSNSYLDGLSLQNLSDELRYRYAIPRDIQGVMISSVQEGSKAEQYGFLKGDIIVQIGQKIIKNIDDLKEAMKTENKQKTLIWINRKGMPQGLVVGN